MPSWEMRLCAIKQEVFTMKTSNLVGLIVALLITTSGFAGINFLFTQVASGHERSAVVADLRA